MIIIEKNILGQYAVKTIPFDRKELTAIKSVSNQKWYDGETKAWLMDDITELLEVLEEDNIPFENKALSQQVFPTTDYVIVENEGKYTFEFSYSEDKKDAIKNAGAMYNPAQKKWHVGTIKKVLDVCRVLSDMKLTYRFDNIVLTETQQEYLKKVDILDEDIERKKDYEQNAEMYREEVQKYLKENVHLYPFQVSAVKYAAHKKRVLLSLQQGLGKTLCSLAYITYTERKKTLVISPNTLTYNYAREVEKFTNLNVFRYTNPKKSTIPEKQERLNKERKEAIEKSDVIVFNIEFFQRKKFDESALKAEIGEYDCVVIDEAHQIKEIKNIRYKNVMKMIDDNLEYVLLLTGTPAPNRLEELFPLFNIVDASTFQSKQKYMKNYLGMVYESGRFGGKYVQKSGFNPAQFFERTSRFVFRKTKEEVLHDMPSKSVNNITINFNKKQKQEYIEQAQIAYDHVTMFDDDNRFDLGVFQKLRGVTAKLKIETLHDYLEEAQNANEKVVVIDFYKETTKSLYDKYKNVSVIVSGDVSNEARDAAVQAFQNDPETLFFFATAQTASVGLTLTASSKMFIVTAPYSFGQAEQIEDRIHRIGTTQNCQIYYLNAEDTIDSIVYYMMMSKREMIQKAIDNVSTVKNADKFSFKLLKKRFQAQFERQTRPETDEDELTEDVIVVDGMTTSLKDF